MQQKRAGGRGYVQEVFESLIDGARRDAALSRPVTDHTYKTERDEAKSLALIN